MVIKDKQVILTSHVIHPQIPRKFRNKETEQLSNHNTAPTPTPTPGGDSSSGVEPIPMS